MTPIVKEKIFEKFKEDSDPIKDLDIGYLIVKIPCRATYHGKEDGKDNWSWSAESMDFHFGQYLPKYIKEYDINFEPLPPKTIDSRDGSLKISGIRKNVITFIKLLYSLNNNQLKEFIKNYTINESLNEKFTEEGDPISDLRIGFEEINFHEKSKKLVSRENLGPWLEYLNSLVGRTIEGLFFKKDYEYKGPLNAKHYKFKIKYYNSYMYGSSIFFTDTDGISYEVLKEENYYISREAR